MFTSVQSGKWGSECWLSVLPQLPAGKDQGFKSPDCCSLILLYIQQRHHRIGQLLSKCLNAYSHVLYWPPSGLITVCRLATVHRPQCEHCLCYFLVFSLCLKYGKVEIFKIIKSEGRISVKDCLLGFGGHEADVRTCQTKDLRTFVDSFIQDISIEGPLGIHSRRMSKS